MARAVVLYAAAGDRSITFLFPFVWMISTSLKMPPQVWVQPPIWIPHPIRFANYLDALTTVPTLRYLKNTVIITVIGDARPRWSHRLWSAFAFSRLEWQGRGVFFLLLLSTMMLPCQVTMIPMFIIFHKLGWVNTFKPLIVPSFFGSAFYIFLLRQFFLSIPKEMDEAAVMDGANPLTIWWRIILPLSQPALARRGHLLLHRPLERLHRPRSSTCNAATSGRWPSG